MGSSGLIGFLQILKGLESGRPQDYEQFWGLRGPPPIRRDMPKISPRRWRYFGLESSVRTTGTVWPADNKELVSPLFLLVGFLTEPRGENSVCVSGVNP